MTSVYLRRFSWLFAVLALAVPARPATVLVLPFHNSSQYSDLNWVGQSISETLKDEFGQLNEIVFDRDSVAESMQHLALRPDANFTKATLIRLGQTLDADYICYGSYDATLPTGDSQLKDSAVQLTTHFIDLRKLHDGADITEAGKLADLSRLEQHLAWESLKYLQPGQNPPLDRFLAPDKMVRLDAEESYIRGLLSSNKEQQEKWFAQAVVLDPHFMSPVFELGKLYLAQKDYRQALRWLEKIPATNARYPEARFKMGLSAYSLGDYNSASGYFREVARTFPMNEVFNDLGAAENQLALPAAIDDFCHALDGDPNNTSYLFNLGIALWRNNRFEDASKQFQAVLDHDPKDSEARTLLNRAQLHEPYGSGNKPPVALRLTPNFDATAFRQLKAMLQPNRSM
ncbi:MAG: tetratricopeptide repeat protein [Acidobacteriaceae bacterium]|nr:tetratricopeptide repeat protein [Acidobacteriaceae bacterium]